jgi:outer membrane protein OmpA-like peptidoglycan-associated protein
MNTFKTLIILSFLMLVENTAFTQPTEKVGKAEKVKIQNLKLVNTAALDFSPAFFKGDLVFVSSSPVAGKKKVFDKKLKQASMSLFISKKDRKNFYHKPEPFDTAFLSRVHEGPVSFDNQNEIMYFTRNDNTMDGKKPRYVKNVNYMKIYASAYASESWGKPELTSFNDERSDACHPTVSADGEKIFFASNRAGGLGGMDLYMCKMVEGAWTNPINLGPEVNSTDNEVFPFIHEDGTLYFSSNRPKGQGALDIYYTRIDSTGDYIKPSSLGKPFNTDKDDFGIIVDTENKIGFFASNRGGGLGGDDIYNFTFSEGAKPFSDVKLLSDANKTGQNDKNKRSVNVYAIDRKSGLPLSKAYICVASTGTQKPSVETAGANCETTITDENGKAVLQLNPSNNYFVRITKSDFKPNMISVLKDDNRNEAIILLDKIGDKSTQYQDDEMASSTDSRAEKDRIYKLRNIYYDYDDASIRPDSRLVIDSLVQVLDDFPDMEIELAAHTDSRGNSPYNINLSKRRANSVIDYLVSKGIKRRRLNAVGYGKQKLTNECGDNTPCPPEKHQENRRTEIRVIKSGGSEGKVILPKAKSKS